MRHLPGDTVTFELTTRDSTTAAAAAEAAGPGLFVTRRLLSDDGSTRWFAGGLVSWQALPAVLDALGSHVPAIESIRVDDRRLTRPRGDELGALLTVHRALPSRPGPWPWA
jgi:hypothetical protein